MERENKLQQLQEKWNRIYQNAQCPGEVAQVLVENLHLLPKQGSALDLAAGLGANAICLAKQGLEVRAWELSDIALEKMNQFARQDDLKITTELRDVEGNPPEKEQFDVIVVSHFLDRRTIPDLIAALKPKGLILYQTFTQIKADPAIGPSSPRFTLVENELLAFFSALKIRVYREEGVIGDTGQGFRNEAMLVAQK